MWHPRGMVHPNTHQQRDPTADAVLSSHFTSAAPSLDNRSTPLKSHSIPSIDSCKYGNCNPEAYQQVKRKARRSSSEECLYKATHTPGRRYEIPRRSSEPTTFIERSDYKRRLIVPQYLEEEGNFDRISVLEAMSRRVYTQENSNTDDSMEPIPFTSCSEQQPECAVSNKSPTASVVTADEEVCLGQDFKPGPWDVVSRMPFCNACFCHDYDDI